MALLCGGVWGVKHTTHEACSAFQRRRFSVTLNKFPFHGLGRDLRHAEAIDALAVLDGPDVLPHKAHTLAEHIGQSSRDVPAIHVIRVAEVQGQGKPQPSR